MPNATLDPTRNAPAALPVRVDESRVQSTYANTIRTSPTTEEVVLDFGMTLPRPAPNGQTAPVFAIDTRVVLNWGNAKRLAIGLAQVVAAYEQRNGEIALTPPSDGRTGS